MSFQTPINGLWLPLITPFRDGKLDEISLRRIVKHYAGKDISGLILAATTGEGQLLDDEELRRLVIITAVEIDGNGSNLPIFLGVSGSDPKKVTDQIGVTKDWPVDGYLLSGPNYLRPSQTGLKRYYETVAGSTDRPILIYNIPYRTGSNISNETLLELAGLPNVIGVKDCCGSVAQSLELLRTAPEGFSVLTGEDPFFYNSLVHGGPGAIVTGAHVLADEHLAIMDCIRNGQQRLALQKWNAVVHIPGLLFTEPSPAPVKYWLWRQGLIDSAQVRAPFHEISDALAMRIDVAIAESAQAIEKIA